MSSSSRLRDPRVLLLLLAVGMSFGFAVWRALLDNFSIREVGFTGLDIGGVQSVREIPGFLAFTAVFLLLVIREQILAISMICLMGIGIALTGYMPTHFGLYFTTVLMSIGFHYYEAVNKSLTWQWLPKGEAAQFMGKIISFKSLCEILAYVLVWLGVTYVSLSMELSYAIGGCVLIAIAVLCWLIFPVFNQEVTQTKKIVLKKRYWLYYALTFMAGARRQIFIVFAGFLMVERFNYSVQDIAFLFLAASALNLFLAPVIGKMIAVWGERNALVIEYIGLFFVFYSYAYVQDHQFAAALYVIDHLFFAMAIAQMTYFQKIGDPADMASTASVAFTINHIAAVFLPVVLGGVWLVSPSAVFLIGAGMAVVSLVLSINVPRHPDQGNETVVGPKFRVNPQAKQPAE